MNRKGYNLIEVLIAMALLAWVVLVIVGLFAYGQKGVYSGKTQTRAVAICQKVHEDLRNMPSYNLKFQMFGADIGDAAGSGAPIDTPCVYTATTNNPFTPGDVLYTTLESWKAALEDLSATSSMNATLTPVIRVDTAATLAIGNCYFIHYHIQVNWTEGLRNRHVTVDFSI
jgi:prepilin-type N-terminal cleavage/methylation domain-containing protein